LAPHPDHCTDALDIGMAWRLRWLLAAAAAVAALLLAGVDVDDCIDPLFPHDAEPETPEPPALSAAIRGLPAHRLNKVQRERLRRDGVVVVRNALHSKKALALLLDATDDRNHSFAADNPMHASETVVAGASPSGNWLHNGCFATALWATPRPRRSRRSPPRRARPHASPRRSLSTFVAARRTATREGAEGRTWTLTPFAMDWNRW
jgi:hypothetical protein